MTFEFATATRIVFGAGTLSGLGAAAAGLGRRAFVVAGQNLRHAARVQSLLQTVGVGSVIHAIAREPSTTDIERGVALARHEGCDLVVGIGGGSAIDAAKAIAALLTNTRPLFDYLEVIGCAQPLDRTPAPCIAIPTTAGTGAEVTRNAVLASEVHKVKVSLRSPLMLPKVAIIDPELTYELPAELTVSTGLDALTQLLEPYVCRRANPLTDGFCREGMQRVARSLRACVDAGGNRAAREDMAMASLLGGLALANAGLGAVHGFAGPIGGAFPAPHGAVCAALLAPVTTSNVQAMRDRDPRNPALARYAEATRILTGRSDSDADTLAPWLREFVAGLGVAPLSKYGLTSADFPALIAAAANASSMKANPIQLTPAECTAILGQALN